MICKPEQLPNDDKHIKRFDISHQWITMMLGDKLYLTPIGTNLDIVDELPSAGVIGSDISPSQPRWVPPNLMFQIGDAQQDWSFEPESFDFIHVRYMQGSNDEWSKLIFEQWAQLFYDVGDKTGRSFKETGFTSVTHKKFKVPYGTLPKDKQLKNLDQYMAFYLNLSLDGFAVYPIGQILVWSFKEVEVLVAKMRSGVRNPNSVVFRNVHAVDGRKPEVPTEHA
ncbi:hypothetical protein B0J13DRAFT_589304 [Dactylonectria estremocensis]|uniref:Uncharacterized protein n=1 Tax=Dactylonectria estremocensis TaxID=1079267 RepID=A0A9P9IKD6_9HYPO|nr:hypothetical protein B0J13DRAFT_589304 [Dactylonectria estremocensis]